MNDPLTREQVMIQLNDVIANARMKQCADISGLLSTDAALRQQLDDAKGYILPQELGKLSHTILIDPTSTKNGKPLAEWLIEHGVFNEVEILLGYAMKTAIASLEQQLAQVRREVWKEVEIRLEILTLNQDERSGLLAWCRAQAAKETQP